MKITRRQIGLSLVELMIAITIGLLMVLAILGVYLTQIQTYKTSFSQGTIQMAENAISEIIYSHLRGAGFSGCATTTSILSNLNAGGAAPLGTLNNAPTMVMGYDANTDITQFNAANDANTSHWSSNLDASLAGQAQAGSDILVILGAVPNSSPVSVTTINPSSVSLVVQSANGLSAGQYGAISDCSKTALFRITGVSGTTISHATGSGALTNATDALAVNFAAGAQFLPMQQTAFFVGYGLGGQSSLMMAILNGNTWTVQPVVPGVDTMQILYGIGTNGIPSQYVTAGNVTNWAQVYSIRIAFLINGKAGSGSQNSANPTVFNVLDEVVTMPADNRLRHVFELTIKLRNAIL